jgi:hypothetical protein
MTRAVWKRPFPVGVALAEDEVDDVVELLLVVTFEELDEVVVVIFVEELEEVVVVFLDELEEVVVVIFFVELVVVVGAASATERMMLRMSTTDSIVRWAKIILKMRWSENTKETSVEVG